MSEKEQKRLPVFELPHYYCPINTAIIAQQAICTSPERSWKEPPYSCVFTLSHKHLLEAKTSNKRFQRLQIRPAASA